MAPSPPPSPQQPETAAAKISQTDRASSSIFRQHVPRVLVPKPLIVRVFHDMLQHVLIDAANHKLRFAEQPKRLRMVVIGYVLANHPRFALLDLLRRIPTITEATMSGIALLNVRCRAALRL